MMDAEIKVEFHHVNQKLDRMLDRQNEFITWQRVVGERLASCTALSDTMAKAIEKNTEDIDRLRRENKTFSTVAASIGAAIGVVVNALTK